MRKIILLSFKLWGTSQY